MSDKSIVSCLAASNHTALERAKNDFYATDPKAMELLLEQEKFSQNVWEPACGAGHLSEVLKEHGYTVKSTDLIDRGYGVGNVDFLNSNEHFDGDIITNPPYKEALGFVSKSLDSIPTGHKVAMFLKLLFLEGKNRKKFFQEDPPKVIYVSSSRLNCARNGDFESFPYNSAVCYAWFVWEKGYKGNPIVKWIN